MKVLFIHRSVGNNLIREGNLRSLLQKYNFGLDDYDNNSGLLTLADGSVGHSSINIPGNNTNPDNLAAYFSRWDELLDSYVLIIIKSCYPNSHIRSDAELETIKSHYINIISTFTGHNKRLIIMTSPPLRPLFTNQQEARLANRLATWLATQTSKQVSIFDFHHLLSETSGRHKGMLRRQYRRLLPYDNHPNRKANQIITPKLAEFISQTVN